MTPLSSSANAIDVRGLDKAFGRHRVCRDLDLQIRRGEIFTLLGPSGSGKSVLLRLLIGLLKPDAGALFVEGTDVAGLPERALVPVRRRVGLLFQGAALFDSLSVGDNVGWGLREDQRWSRADRRSRVAECLDAVGLPGTETMRPANLSGGMKKRVGLARALAPSPAIMLYDEPTTGLDPSNARRINELIVDLRGRFGVTSMVITHDIQAALAVSDRLGLLAEGRVAVTVTAAQARAAPPPLLARFIGGESLEEHA